MSAFNESVIALKKHCINKEIGITATCRDSMLEIIKNEFQQEDEMVVRMTADLLWDYYLSQDLIELVP